MLTPAIPQELSSLTPLDGGDTRRASGLSPAQDEGGIKVPAAHIGRHPAPSPLEGDPREVFSHVTQGPRRPAPLPLTVLGCITSQAFPAPFLHFWASASRDHPQIYRSPSLQVSELL